MFVLKSDLGYFNGFKIHSGHCLVEYSNSALQIIKARQDVEAIREDIYRVSSPATLTLLSLELDVIKEL